VATPLSIASYRLATSPSDKNNQDVLEWLEQLVSSVRDTGSKSASRAFTVPQKQKNSQESDEEVAVVDDNDANDDWEDVNAEDQIESSLPEPHVPLGLIANLSLSNKQPSRKPKKNEGAEGVIALAEDDFNDDNVVCTACLILPVKQPADRRLYCQGVANETYFMPG
jgi:hypothetical protein